MNDLTREALRPNRALADPMALMPADTRGALVPQSMGEAFECAKIMATGKFSVPSFLKGNPGDCLRVVLIATRTALDAFMLADHAMLIKNRSGEERMSFDAQAIHAIVMASGHLDRGFDLKFSGEGEALCCEITGYIDGRSKAKTYRLRSITTRNSPLWKTDPEQQLGYYSERAWCRLYAPHAMMGLIAREDPPIDVSPDAVRISGNAPQNALAAVEAHLGVGDDPEDETESASGETEGRDPEGEPAAEQGRDSPPDRGVDSPAPASEGTDSGGQLPPESDRLRRLKQALAKRETPEQIDAWLGEGMVIKTIAKLTPVESEWFAEHVENVREAHEQMS